MQLCVGNPMLGWSLRAVMQRPKIMEPSMPIADSIGTAVEQNARIVQECICPKDAALAMAAEAEAKEDIDLGVLMSPFESLDAV